MIFARVSLLACLMIATALPAAAAALDGEFDGASSVAGGTGECWGNNPASALVSGSTLTIRYVAYDGTSEPVTATIAADGTFRTTEPISNGTIAYSGRVTPRRIVANWKGPVCYGTLEMTR